MVNITTVLTAANALADEMTVTGINAVEETEKSLAEVLSTAGLNTLMGVGIVFVVLVLISFIIWLFGFVNKFEGYMADRKLKKQQKAKGAEPVKTEVETVPEPEEDEEELIAVITAAIVASQNVRPDSFVVTSIRRREDKLNWKRG